MSNSATNEPAAKRPKLPSESYQQVDDEIEGDLTGSSQRILASGNQKPNKENDICEGFLAILDIALARFRSPCGIAEDGNVPARMVTPLNELKQLCLEACKLKMFTALVVKLVHSVACFPEEFIFTAKSGTNFGIGVDDISTEQDIRSRNININFENAMKISKDIISAFLSKCCNTSKKCHYHNMFKHFIQDLLMLLNKPKWPAAEILIGIIGTLLLENLEDRTLKNTVRVNFLQYLGMITSALRKEHVKIKMDTIDIENLVAKVKSEEPNTEAANHAEPTDTGLIVETLLQKTLLKYLTIRGQYDPTVIHAKYVYLALWCKDAPVKFEKLLTSSNTTVLTRKNYRFAGVAAGNEIERQREDRNAELAALYLASTRPLVDTASFDLFLQEILRVSSKDDSATILMGIRCLTMVLKTDASVLERSDVDQWVQDSLLVALVTKSPCVREEAVNFLGECVLANPDLIERYFEPLSGRIIDPGLRVRKRVIRVFRDICIKCPDIPKIPQICAKMLTRLNDEDSIRLLIVDMFQNMWFSPIPENPLDGNLVRRKVMQIMEVTLIESKALELIEQLLHRLFKPEDPRSTNLSKAEPLEVFVSASRQIVNGLVEYSLWPDKNAPLKAQILQSDINTVFCVKTLKIFAKIRPHLLVEHAFILHKYLRWKTEVQNDQTESTDIPTIFSILGLLVPFLVNPSESFLKGLEEDCVKLLLVDVGVDESFACLAAVVNITHNYDSVRFVFIQLQGELADQMIPCKDQVGMESDVQIIEIEDREFFGQIIFALALCLKYFDFTSSEVNLSSGMNDCVFEKLLCLLKQPSVARTPELQLHGLKAIGYLCNRRGDLMLGNELERIYKQYLTNSANSGLQTQTLNNILLYLDEEGKHVVNQLSLNNNKVGNINELVDFSLEMPFQIVQTYLTEIFEVFDNICTVVAVRMAAIRVLCAALQQRLVTSAQIQPHLSAMEISCRLALRKNMGDHFSLSSTTHELDKLKQLMRKRAVNSKRMYKNST